MLHIEDKWVWDFWFAEADDGCHVFFLQAPRSLGDPELRHHSATIGHALLQPDRSWKVLDDALLPGPPGSWDDLATWTGSVIWDGARWCLLYTGINGAEGGRVQRIGLAISEDLLHWEKHRGNPVMEADPRWYEQLSQGRWRDQSWRDPWVFRHEQAYHALIAARSRDDRSPFAGVLAHARSWDLVRWEIMEPLTEPGEFAQVECPQLVEFEGSITVLFSCLAEDHSPERRRRKGVRCVTGTYAFTAPGLMGPFRPSDEPVVVVDPFGAQLYGGKVVERADGGLAFVAFRSGNGAEFAGDIIDSVPMTRRADGRLEVHTADAVTVRTAQRTDTVPS